MQIGKFRWKESEFFLKHSDIDHTIQEGRTKNDEKSTMEQQIFQNTCQYSGFCWHSIHWLLANGMVFKLVSVRMIDNFKGYTTSCLTICGGTCGIVHKI